MPTNAFPLSPLALVIRQFIWARVSLCYNCLSCVRIGYGLVITFLAWRGKTVRNVRNKLHLLSVP